MKQSKKHSFCFAWLKKSRTDFFNILLGQGGAGYLKFSTWMIETRAEFTDNGGFSVKQLAGQTVTTISKSALVPYSASDMYALVDDIESYPRFLPWCTAARVLSRDEDEVRAVLELSRGGMHKTFTTCNRLQRHKMIELRLLEGPFRHLEGFWRFSALSGDSCKVSLDMDFEFSNKLTGLVFGPVFNQIANALVDAFCKRATEVYGRRNDAV